MTRLADLVAATLAEGGGYPPRVDAAVDAAMEGDEVDGALCECEAAATALALLDQAGLGVQHQSVIADFVLDFLDGRPCPSCDG